MIRYPNGVGEFKAYDHAPAIPHTRHDTYLHAGAPKTGWPADHSVDDTYECPPHTWAPRVPDHETIKAPEDHEYTAEFRRDGSAVLVLHTSKVIAKLDTYDDAVAAAKALNEHKGY